MAQKLLMFIGTDGFLTEHNTAADEITFLSGQFANVKIAGNTITSEDAAGDINITPDTTGDLVLDGVKWPQADGSALQFLQTDGAGQTSWQDITDDVVAERICNSYTADETLALGDTLYISAADNVSKGDVSTAANAARIIGMAKAIATDTNPVDVQSEGLFVGLTGLTAAARYYADPGVAGGITATLPVGTGNVLVLMGHAKSTTELQMQITDLGRRAG